MINACITLIFDQVFSLQKEQNLTDAQVAEFVSQILKNNFDVTPFAPEHVDTLYRLSWLLGIRAIARDQVGLVTAAMQLDIVTSGGMTLQEVKDDATGIETYSPAYILPREELGYVWESSANAVLEVTRFSGSDVRLLVSAPFFDWRTEQLTEESGPKVAWWNDSTSGSRNLLLTGQLLQDFAAPKSEDEYIFRMQQIHASGGIEGQLDLLALIDTNGVQIDPAIRIGVVTRTETILGDIPSVTARINHDDWNSTNSEVVSLALDTTHELKQLNQAELAVQLGKKIASIHPNNYKVEHDIAHSLSMMGRDAEALTHIQHAIELNSEDHLCHELSGYVLAGLGRTEEAIASYTRSLEIFPSGAISLNNRGELHAKKGAYEIALKDFDEVLTFDENPTTRRNRADALLHLKRFDEALVDADIALQSLYGNPTALLVKSSVFEQRGVIAGAISQNLLLLKTSPTHDNWVDTAQANLKRFGYSGPVTYPFPRSTFEQRFEQHPQRDLVYRFIDDSNYYLQQQNFDAAMQTADAFVEHFSADLNTAPPQPWVNRANVKRVLQDFEGAVADARKAIDLAPDCEFAHVALAESSYDLGNVELAINEMKIAAELAPHQVSYWQYRGFLEENAGKMDDALNSINTGLSYDPGFQDLLFNKGRILSLMDDVAGSRASYETLLQIFPHDSGGWLNLATTYQTDDVPKAISLLERAIDARLDYVFAYQKLAFLRDDLGKAWVDGAISETLVREIDPNFFSQNGLTEKPDLDYAKMRIQPLLDAGLHVEMLDVVNQMAPTFQTDANFWMWRSELGYALNNDEGDQIHEESISIAKSIDPTRPAFLLKDFENGVDEIQLFGNCETLIVGFPALSSAEREDAAYQIATFAAESSDKSRGLKILNALQNAATDVSESAKTHVLFKLAFALDLAGDREGSIAAYTTLIERVPEEGTYKFNRACEYAVLGQLEPAISDLKDAIRISEHWRESAMSDNYFDPIRDSPEFQSVVSG